MVDPESVHQVYLYRTVEGKESETGAMYARYEDMVIFRKELVDGTAAMLGVDIRDRFGGG